LGLNVELLVLILQEIELIIITAIAIKQ